MTVCLIGSIASKRGNECQILDWQTNKIYNCFVRNHENLEVGDQGFFTGTLDSNNDLILTKHHVTTIVMPISEGDLMKISNTYQHVSVKNDPFWEVYASLMSEKELDELN